MAENRDRFDKPAAITIEPRDSEDRSNRKKDIWYLALVVVMFIIWGIAPRPILYNSLADAARELINMISLGR